MPAYTWTTAETITAAKLNALETEAWRIANDLAIGTSTGSESGNNAGGGYIDIGPTVSFTAKSTSVFGFLLIDYVSASIQTSYETAEVNFAIRMNSVDNYIGTTRLIYLRSETGSMANGVIITGLTAGTTYTAKTRAYARTDRYPTYGDNVFSIGNYGRNTIGILQINK